MPGSSVVSRIRHGSHRALARVEGGPWWQSLDPHFSFRPETFDLALKDRLRVSATAGVDVLIRTLGACMLSATALPRGFHPLEMKRSFRDAAFYGQMAESQDPERFFKPPPAHVPVYAQSRRWPVFWPKGGICEDLSFQSPFQPSNPRIRDHYLGHKNNRQAHARYWRHGDAGRPTVVAIHGFSGDLVLVNEYLFALPRLFEMGYDVILVTLPFHGLRQTRFSPFSGYGFFAQGPCGINEAVAQSVCDVRVLIDWLGETRRVSKVGVLGVSLGGFVSAVLTTVEPRLQFSIPHVPLATIPDVIMEWQPVGALMQGALRSMGYGIEDARYLLAASSPLTYAPIVDRERLMIIAGVADRLAPPKHSRLLWEHWDHCKIHWFPGSHLIHLDRGAYLVQIARFLQTVGFRGRQSYDQLTYGNPSKHPA